MTRDEAARAMGVAPSEIKQVEASAHGTLVWMKSGARRLIGDDGFYSVDDHSANAHLRRFQLPETDPVEDPDGPDDEAALAASTVPDGTVDEVLAWVGPDRRRAAAAIEAEAARGERVRPDLLQALGDLGPQDSVDVPGGTVEEILAWVGEDQERALAALARERAKPGPRKSLIKRLEEL